MAREPHTMCYLNFEVVTVGVREQIVVMGFVHTVGAEKTWI